MIKDIEFLSLTQMRRRRRTLDTVVVSVLDESELRKDGRPRLGGFRSTLALTFEDTAEEPGAPQWPNEPDEVEHRVFASHLEERVPSLSDAKRIVDFVNEHHRSPEQLHLVAHCFGGISRSAAIAEWASARCWAPILEKTPDRSNPRLLRLLHQANAATS